MRRGEARRRLGPRRHEGSPEIDAPRPRRPPGPDRGQGGAPHRGRTRGARPGRAEEVPRAAHAEFEPGPDRPDPVALLERQADDAACPSSCRSATGGCWSRRSPSTAARR